MTQKNGFIGAAAVAALLMLAALATPGGVAAQDTVPLFLAIPETFPDVDGRVVLLRERGRDVVLLRHDDATPETLSIALGLLKRLNERRPRDGRYAHMVPITGYKLTSPLDPARLAQLDAALGQLKERPVHGLGNLGFGRSMLFVASDQ